MATYMTPRTISTEMNRVLSRIEERMKEGMTRKELAELMSVAVAGLTYPDVLASAHRFAHEHPNESCVYVAYGHPGDVVLYVGTTKRAPKRMYEHLADSLWMKDMSMVTFKAVPHSEAFREEWRTIKELKPIYNRKGNENG